MHPGLEKKTIIVTGGAKVAIPVIAGRKEEDTWCIIIRTIRQ